MLLFGYDQGVFGESNGYVRPNQSIVNQHQGGILTLIDFQTRFELRGDETAKGIIVGSYDLGCLGGALTIGPVGGLIGRKKSVLLGTTIMMLGAFLQFLAPNFGIMTAGRSDTHLYHDCTH